MRASVACVPIRHYEKLAPRPHQYLLENLRLTAGALLKEGAVGDINYSFFDGEGRTLPDWNVFPSLGAAQAQEMVRKGKKVVVAVGNYKLSALRAALRGRLFNVLITDERAARDLLASD